MNAITLRRAGLRSLNSLVYLAGAVAQPGWQVSDSRGCLYWLVREIPEGILCRCSDGPNFDGVVLMPWRP